MLSTTKPRTYTNRHEVRKTLLLFVFLIAGTAISYAQGEVKVTDKKPAYEPGQVWSYKTRPDEKTSTLVILKVEQDKELGKIVHIAIRDLKMKGPNGRILTTANHLPFAAKSIDESVIKLLSEDEDLPNYLEGYTLWKQAFDAKKAGIYTIPVSEAVEVMELTFKR